MTNAVNEELEGITLTVYAFVVHAKEPVGIRDVTRGAKLSSTSVAYRHLQKLEDLGLVEKNESGDYVLREKTSINGHVWVGRNLIPRLIFFSLFFIGAFSMESAVIILGFLSNYTIELSFYFLTAFTGLAALLFMFEGRSLLKKLDKR
jgi:hypothetical protein